MYNAGVRTFISGAALGFDTLAALAVLDARRSHSDIALKLFLPCRDQNVKWKESEKQMYDKLLQQADEIKYISDAYSPMCMHMRNDAMINASEHCIAYCYKSFGGAAYTVKRAVDEGLNIVMI